MAMDTRGVSFEPLNTPAWLRAIQPTDEQLQRGWTARRLGKDSEVALVGRPGRPGCFAVRPRPQDRLQAHYFVSVPYTIAAQLPVDYWCHGDHQAELTWEQLQEEMEKVELLPDPYAFRFGYTLVGLPRVAHKLRRRPPVEQHPWVLRPVRGSKPLRQLLGRVGQSGTFVVQDTEYHPLSPLYGMVQVQFRRACPDLTMVELEMNLDSSSDYQTVALLSPSELLAELDKAEAQGESYALESRL